MTLHSWPFDIVGLIHRVMQHKPLNSGLIIGPEMDTSALEGDWAHHSFHEMSELPFRQRYDMAVVYWHASAQALEGGVSHSPHEDIEAITRLRDLHARQVIVVSDPQHTESLRALGFTQFETLADHNIWQFNILSYKQVPDWLNAKYWANPQNWGKYRW